MYYIMSLIIIIFSSTLCYAADDAGQVSIYKSTEISDVELITNDIDKIKISNEPIITMDDIVSYSKRRHVLELSPEAYNRFMNEDTGTVFVVCVGKERIFAGAIWSDLLSSICGGIVVLKPVYLGETDQSTNNTSAKIFFQLGYPSEKYFDGNDARSDPRLIRAIEKAGKLSSWF